MKICAIFNIFPLYRSAIYKKMDDQFDIDFIFGSHAKENIALANPSQLKGYKYCARNIFKGTKLVWQRGAIRKAFSKKYTHYILTGNTGILSNWAIVLIAKLLGRQTILWTHSLYGNETGMKRFKNVLFLKLADKIFTYSERGVEIAINYGIKSSKLIPIYNSLDYTKQIELAKRIGDRSFARNYFGNDNPYICFIGRLTPQKRVDLLLKATIDSGINYNIIILGDGGCRKELEDLSQTLGIEDRVWFYGECYDESFIATVLSHAKLSISPGNCGLNAIESLTYGTPMVTHSNLFNQMPEVEAVVELCKKTGRNLLFEENNTDSLGRVIENNITIDDDNIRQVAQSIIADKWNADRQIDIMVHNLR